MGPNRPGATQTTATSGGGGSDGDLLVLSEEGPLVGAADVLEDPVHLLVLRLVGRGDQWAAAAAVGLLRVLHHLPEEQLLHLGQKGAVRRREEEEQPWRCPAATHRGDSTELWLRPARPPGPNSTSHLVLSTPSTCHWWSSVMGEDKWAG